MIFIKKDRIAQVLFVIGMIVFFSCNGIGYSKSSCDEIYFHDDNKKNDTNKLIVEDRAVFDTTANMLRGIIVDSLSNEPVIGAKVYIWNGSKKYIDSTDANGNFQFFKDNFSGIWQMMVYHSKLQCLEIKNIDIGGRLSIRIKLHKWLTKN